MQNIVGNVSVMAANTEGRRVREYDGSSRDREHLSHNVVRDMRQIDQHSDSIHLVNHCL